MNSPQQLPPWEHLEELVETAGPEQVEAYLESLPAAETARAVTRLSEEDQSQLLSSLQPGEAADVIHKIPGVQAVEMLDELPPATAARIIEELPSDERADILGDLPEPRAEEILSALSPDVSDELRALVQYPDDVAGMVLVAHKEGNPRAAVLRAFARGERPAGGAIADTLCE